MKRISTIFFACLLASLIILGSGGLTVGKMICGGNECATAYTLGAAKDCCENENTDTENVQKDCCCVITDLSYSLDDFNSSEKVNLSFFGIDLFTTTPITSFQFPTTLINSTFRSPSPPGLQDYLHLIGALLL